MNSKTDGPEWRWVLVWAVLIVIISSIPYLWGIWITPPGYHFLGLTHNIDDGAVYLSWMRQAADGHLFIRNLFTNEPQRGRAFNVLFLLMGWFAALTRLSLIWVYHVFRAGLGIGLIFAIWQFSKPFLEDSGARKLLIPLVGLSAGVGWLFPSGKPPTGPVDIWQPEAITFLSIYLNPLFLAAQVLMLGALYSLLLAHRTGHARYAAYAGVSMLLLGNIHTYDVVTVAAVWVAYLLIVTARDRKLDLRSIGLSLIAALIALPSAGYQLYVYRIDEVFRARANTPTPSPPIWSFFAGYGLVLIGAAVGASLYVRSRPRSRPHSPLSALHSPLLLAWSLIGFMLPYIPVAQQRKLVMGLHIPLCILCAAALSALASRIPRTVRGWTLAAFVVLTFASNARFLANDISLLNNGTTAPHYAPFISTAELDAIRHFGDNTRWYQTVLAPPTFSLFLPALAGRQVWYGHWSETPDYADKIRQWARLALPGPNVSMRERREVIRRSGAFYVVHIEADGRRLVRSPRSLNLEYLWASGDPRVVIYRVTRRLDRAR